MTINYNNSHSPSSTRILQGVESQGSLLPTGAYVIPLAGISERGGEKGGSGYGCVGLVGVGSSEEGLENVSLPFVKLFSAKEQISMETRELRVVGM